MADDTDQGGLAWVQEPAISEGKVVYRYRNSGDSDATFVGEQVSAHTQSSGSTSQMFQVQNLAVGAEQETHAPLPADLADGPVTIYIEIQSSNGQTEVGHLSHELSGQIAGGALHPAGEAAATAGTLAVDARDVKLEGDELMIHYRITGDAHLDAVSIFVSVLDPRGGPGWMNSFVAEADREDIFRTAIPFGEMAIEPGEAWTIEATVMGADTNTKAQGFVRVNLPIEQVDGTVVAAGGWSSLAES